MELRSDGQESYLMGSEIKGKFMHLMQTKPKNRRAFLKGMARLGILTGFVSTGIALGLRKNKGTPVSDKCPITGPCENCWQRVGCNNYKK
jgi:hypothetical protein